MLSERFLFFSPIGLHSGINPRSNQSSRSCLNLVTNYPVVTWNTIYDGGYYEFTGRGACGSE